MKKYNIVVIGCRMGTPHIKAVVADDNAHLYGICDLDTTLLDKLNKEFNPDKAVVDWHEFINDPNVDAAIVATPDNLHLEMTEAFLKAGKEIKWSLVCLFPVYSSGILWLGKDNKMRHKSLVCAASSNCQ